MAGQDFRVQISGGSVSLDDWRQAMTAAEAELPGLTENQKKAARIVAMTEHEYARGVLADELGRKRQLENGRLLGAIIGEMLNGSGRRWRLYSLVRKGVQFQWIARFEGPGTDREVEIPIELADDVVESGDSFSKNRLERLLAGKLEQSAA
jgi:hypothetical protein